MKKILLIATGGTIASVEDERGLRPGVHGEALARCVPELNQLADFQVAELMNIDSTNMTPAHWIKIARCIEDNYDDFDGFIVLHGTDTMSYTAAALSYLVQDSPKPIVLTGSQRPMASSFTDAKLNLFQSMVYAVDDNSHDVAIVFAGKAIAGTRGRKQRTMSHNAFISVNFPELALIRDNHVLRPGGCAQRHLEPIFYHRLCDRVFVLKLIPGIDPSIFQVLKDSYDALIIETFGVGGIPDYQGDGSSFKEAIFDWVDSGKAVVLTTQVPEEGCDMGVYEVGYAYSHKEGILLGEDMTTEALVAKTMWVLGQDLTRKEMQEAFYKTVNFDRMGV